MLQHPRAGFVTEAGPITVNNVMAGTGNVVINNATGDMTINTVTATSGGVDLTAASGSILDGNGASNNITASANSSLSALGGVVGLGPDPIEVNVNGGTLSVAASSQVNGISVTINGTVSPSNALLPLNAPPGLILFNGNPPPSQSVVGGAIGSLSLGSFMRNSSTLESIRELPAESQVVVLVVEDSEPETLLAGEGDGVGAIAREVGRQVEEGSGASGESGTAVSSLIPSLSGVVPGDSVAGENGAVEHRLQEEQVAVAMGKSIDAGHRKNGSGMAGRDNSGTHDTVLAQDNLENGRFSLTERIERGLDTPEGAALKNDVLFGFESWRISDQGIQALMKVAEWLKANPKKRLVIEGHCDERGSVAYNLMLGEKRAKAVKNILVTFGANAKQLKVVSYGKERPICNASNEACYQQNRRGHFVLRVP
jgi:peptidoglycan-associated lipoprotein